MPKEILKNCKVEKLPIVDAAGHLKGLITIKDIQKVKDFPNAAKDSQGRLLIGAAVGTGSDVYDRAEMLVKAGIDVLVVDTAHGHSATVISTVKNLREKYRDLPPCCRKYCYRVGGKCVDGCGSGRFESRNRAGFYLHHADRRRNRRASGSGHY